MDTTGIASKEAIAPRFVRCCANKKAAYDAVNAITIDSADDVARAHSSQLRDQSQRIRGTRV